MSSRRISKTPTVEEISEHKAVENTLKRVNTIDGSYHHLEVIWDQAYTYWYNQLAGTDNMCSPSISAPHGGDGNNRYASGYQWFPNEVGLMRLQTTIGILIHRQTLLNNMEIGLCSWRLFLC